MNKAFFLVLIASASAHVESGCGEGPELQRHEHDCTKYYQCDHNRRVLRDCGPGTAFDVRLQICNWPFLVDCDLVYDIDYYNAPSFDSNSINDVDSYYDKLHATWLSRVSDNFRSDNPEFYKFEQSRRSETRSNRLPNGCPVDFSLHYLLAHETDCSKFYSCGNGIKYPMQCAPGTLFDQSSQICNWPSLVNCHNGVSTTSGTTVSISSSSSTWTTARPTSTSINDDKLSNGCPADFNVHKLLPHESDCGKFYSCSNGNKIAMNCAAGTLFDFKNQICDWPHLVQCLPTTSSSTVQSSTITSTPSTTSSKTTKSESSLATNEPIVTSTEIPASINTTVSLTTLDISTIYTSPKTEESTTENAIIGSTASITPTNIDLLASTLPESPLTPESPHGPTTHDFGTTEESKTTAKEAGITTSDFSTSSDYDFSSITIDVTDNPSSTNTLGASTAADISTTLLSIENSTTNNATESLPTLTTPALTENPEINNEILSTTITTSITSGPDFEDTSVADTTNIKFTGTTDTVSSNATEVPDITVEPTISTLPETSTEIIITNNEPSELITDSDEITSPFTTDAYSTTTSITTILSSTDGLTVQQSTTDSTPFDTTIDNEITTASKQETSTENSQFESTTLFIATTTNTESNSNTTQGSNNVATTIDYVTTTDSTTQSTSNSTENTSSSSNEENTEVTKPTSIATDLTTATKAPLCPPGIFGNVPHPNLCNSFYMCAGGRATQLFCREGFEFNTNQKSCVPIAPGGCTLGNLTTPAANEINTVTTGYNETTINTITNSTLGRNITTTVTITESMIVDDITILYTTSQNPVTTDANSSEVYSTTEDILVLTKTTPMDTETPIFSTTTLADSTTNNTLITNTSTVDTQSTVTIDKNATDIDFTTKLISETTSTTPVDADQETTNDVTSQILTSTTSATSDTAEGQTIEPTTILSSERPDHITSAGVTTNSITDATLSTTSQTKPYTTTEVENNETEFTSTVEYNSTSEESKLTSADDFITTQSATTPNTEVTTDSGWTSPETDVTNTTAGGPLCPPGVFGNFPHPDLCNSFYMCAGGVPVQLFCRDGFEFDHKSKTCVAIKIGGCSIPTVITTDSTTISEPTTRESKSTSVELTSSTNIDEVTTRITDGDTVETTYYVETSTMKLTSTSAYENDTDKVTEAVTTTVAPLCPSGTFGNVPHPELCNSFYMCVGGIATQLFCREGFEFSHISKTCIQISDGGCTLGYRKSSVKIKRAVSDSVKESLLESDIVKYVNRGKMDSVVSESRQKDINKVKCRKDGTRIPHPHNCNSFYVCTKKEIVELHCPNGYEFDVKLQVCTLISNDGQGCRGRYARASKYE